MKLFIPVSRATMLALAMTAFAANAQKKQLTTGQMLRNEPNKIVAPLPAINGWADDTHYIKGTFGRRSGGGGSTQVDVLTGAETPYTPPPAKGTTVAIKDRDIYLTKVDGTETRLTKTADVEQNPTLSPDGSKVAYTFGGNLYIIDVATGKQSQITNDGTDVIYNGYASWVYYEEILGRPTQYRAFWWSPDSKNLAWMHFNDTRVPMFPIYNSEGQHGFTENTRYPEAGDPNPEVKMGFYNLAGNKITWADFDEKADTYLGTPFWSPDGTSLWMQWMNRDQNNLKVYAVSPSTGAKKEIYNETQKTWLDWFDDIDFLKDNQGFIVKTDKSGWMHLYWYGMDGKLKSQITSGNYTVTGLKHIDEKNKLVYFTARKENSARVDFYKVNFNGKGLVRLTSGQYNHNISLSPNGSYFTDSYSNVATPTKLAVYDNKGKLVKDIADSKGEEFNDYELATTQLLRVKTSDGFDLPLTLMLPTNYQAGKKYPLIISIYGGPNAGTVMDNWRFSGQSQWWAKEGIIQVALDHRASGHFGKMGQNYIYKDLGKWEMADYITMVKYLEDKYGADPKKIMITGGSYGGYISAYALTYGADVFTHGIANFGVMDWSLYDSHYTERYMGTPKNNPEGYKSSSVLTHADKLKGVLRIVHGTMDDNVHMQNSIQLTSKLQDLGKSFEFMLYSGQRHGFRDPAKAAHQQMETNKFIYKYLLEKPYPEADFKRK
ncbi:S9 family peptidase [Mucilaginibacter pallidiroseus]|uniref:S9 family peptidase n=1 Tax=Mucilaginibacter pallidiroseus TaxID=2599295 RepID=A0A563UF67_9SPHI|nr:S9 family peptidase [Mucilaginibacter pallidiroseus]TWR30020.1 S9 family peptidase [Mucilaginibacter pallidiroseus]